MAAKDVDEMLALLLPLAKRFVTVAAHTPRAMPAETLAEHSLSLIHIWALMAVAKR